MSKNNVSTADSKKSEQSSSETASQVQIYAFMILMVITGSINTISNKLQQSMDSLGKAYSHPWFITFNLFVAEFSMQIPHWIMYFNSKNKAKKESVFLREDAPITSAEYVKKKQEIPILYMAIPAMCDVFGSTLMVIGVAMMAGSVFQMLRGSVILFTALASVYFLKRILYRHHFLGFVVLGLVFVGLGAMIELDGKGAKTEFLGVLLVILGQTFTAAQFVVEEKLMDVYTCHPIKLVGFEGMWASSVYLVLMIIFYFSPCPFSNDSPYEKYICVNNDQDKWVIEDFIFAFKQLGANGWILFNMILFTFSIALFNYVGISVTKYVSSAARAVLDSIRTVVVWLFFLTMPFVPEKSKEDFSWLQLGGFIFLIIGTFLYTEVVTLPCFGLDQYTMAALKQKETEDGALKANKYEDLVTQDEVERAD